MALDARQIQEVIPHRWPFLFVDRILELERGVRAVGIKQFTSSEPFFQGHFPGNPVVPGVLLVEALAQVGSVALLTLPGNKGKIPYFASIGLLQVQKAGAPRRLGPPRGNPHEDARRHRERCRPSVGGQQHCR